MVTLQYAGRTFNCLFQYAFARLFAEANNLRLGAEWKYEDFLPLCKPPSGGNEGIISLTLRNMPPGMMYDPDWLIPRGYFMDKRVLIRGYFQYPHFYQKNKDKILSWFSFPSITGEHKDHIVAHFRLDDYIKCNKQPVINPVWYYNIIKQNEDLQGKELYGVVQRPKVIWENEYLRKVKILLPNIKIIYRDDPKDDWNFIRQFGTVLCSNSSFCWWAAFTGAAKKVYCFHPWWPDVNSTTLSDTDGWIKTSGSYYWS